jgi:hypothetical protein
MGDININIGIEDHENMLKRVGEKFGAGADPVGIFKAMKHLKVGNIPKTYASFSTLDEYQANKFHSLYVKLDDAEKEMVLNHVKTLDDPVGASILTTKNDKCRILELRSYVGAQALWDRALGSMTRIELDARNSHVEDDEEENKRNAWFQLVSIFNNRTSTNQFQPQNRVVRYDEDGNKTNQSSDSERITADVVKKLFDLDPNEKSRPMRDPKWLKSQYSLLKTDISIVWNKFTKSGEHKGDLYSAEGTNEWVFKFSSNKQIIMYAIFALEVQTLNHFGRALPESAQKDSGIISTILDSSDDNHNKINNNNIDSSFNSPQQQSSCKNDSTNSSGKVLGSNGKMILAKSAMRNESRKRKREENKKTTTQIANNNDNNNDDNNNNGELDPELYEVRQLSRVSALQSLLGSTTSRKKRKHYASLLHKQLGIPECSSSDSGDDNIEEDFRGSGVNLNSGGFYFTH